MREWIRIAEIVKTKTLDGGLVVRSTAGLPFLLTEGMKIAFVPPQIDAPRRAIVETCQHLKGDSYFVTFDAVSNRDTAETLIGCSCLSRREVLPLDFDAKVDVGLIGFTVVDEVFGLLGEVAEHFERPAQDLLMVQGLRGEILIPYVDAFVCSVDSEDKQITTKIPAGLLNLATHETSAVGKGDEGQ